MLFYRTRLRKRNEEDKDVKSPSTPVDIKMDVDVKIKKEIEIKANVDSVTSEIETVTISDEEDGMFFCENIRRVLIDYVLEGREVLSFNPKAPGLDEKGPTYTSVRELFGEDESVYVMDAKNAGNIGRFLNVSVNFFSRLFDLICMYFFCSIRVRQTCLFKMCLWTHTIRGFHGCHSFLRNLSVLVRN